MINLLKYKIFYKVAWEKLEKEIFGIPIFGTNPFK